MLLDYFADFEWADSMEMTCAWYAMVDQLFEFSKRLPHHWAVADTAMPMCKHSWVFCYDFMRFLRILPQVFDPQRKVFTTTGITPLDPFDLELAELHMKGFKTGIKPWQQYLYKNAPGFAAPPVKIVDTNEEDADGEDAELGRVKGREANYKGKGKQKAELEESEYFQIIPQGGLGVIKSQIDRMRTLTAEVAQVRSANYLSMALTNKLRRIKKTFKLRLPSSMPMYALTSPASVFRILIMLRHLNGTVRPLGLLLMDAEC